VTFPSVQGIADIDFGNRREEDTGLMGRRNLGYNSNLLGFEGEGKMSKLKLVCALLSLVFCVGVVSNLTVLPPIMADEERVDLNAKYPIMPGPADISFSFDVEIRYVGGTQPRTFELSADGPLGWTVSIQQSYQAVAISAVRLDPTKTYPETIKVVATAPYWQLPEPGDYVITLKAASGEIKGSVDLTARVTARYDFSVKTEDERLNVKATAGEESHLTIIVTNTGTAPLHQITFRSIKPVAIAGEAWSVTFEPDKIEDLNPSDEREVEVTIKPPPKTIAGDYMVTLEFSSDPSTSIQPPKLEIRVQVGTSTKWGWVGIGVVVAVVVGLLFSFKQTGRR